MNQGVVDRPLRRILIVDDAAETRAILAIALRTIHSASVEVLDNAEDALIRLGQQGVDVLVTDVRMGAMNGLDLLEMLRERGLWPACGAVVISGETDPDLGRRARETGAAAFYSKPFSASEVRRSVLTLLETSGDIA